MSVATSPLPAERAGLQATHPGYVAAAEQPILEVCDLRKVFVKRSTDPEVPWWARWRRRAQHGLVAVDRVSFSIQPGEIFGLLGPNGAGKSTTIRMLATLLQPSAGRATLNGYDVATQPGLVRQHLGAVLTGERSIYWKLTGRENLEYFAALYGFGFAFAALVLLMRDANTLIDASNFLISILSGSQFPVQVLPRLLLPLSLAIPLTYGFDAVRALLLGSATLLPLPYELLILVVFMLVMTPLGYLVFKRVERRCQTLGTLGQH